MHLLLCIINRAVKRGEALLCLVLLAEPSWTDLFTPKTLQHVYSNNFQDKWVAATWVSKS